VYKFKGREGEFLTGIPARDLDDDEVAALPEAQRDFLKEHMKLDDPLYQKVADRKARDDDQSAKVKRGERD
jgi:hypothetical protein